MDTALKIVDALQRITIPQLFMLLGGVFLLLAFVGKIGTFIEIPPTRQKWAALLGALFLITGIVLSVATPAKPRLPQGPDIASGDEVTLGLLVYKLLSVQRSNPVPGKLSLLVTIRLTTQDKRALLYRDSFRLLVDGVPLAPERDPKLLERVDSNSVEEGTIRFIIPDMATDVKLQIIGQGAYKDERKLIPINLKEVKP